MIVYSKFTFANVHECTYLIFLDLQCHIPKLCYYRLFLLNKYCISCNKKKLEGFLFLLNRLDYAKKKIKGEKG